MSKKIQKIVATVLCIMMFAMPVYAATAKIPNFKDFGTMYEGQFTKFKGTYHAGFQDLTVGDVTTTFPTMFRGVANVLPADQLIEEGEIVLIPEKAPNIDKKYETAIHSAVKAKVSVTANSKVCSVGKAKKLEDGTYEYKVTLDLSKWAVKGEDPTITASYKKGNTVKDTVTFKRGESNVVSFTVEPTCEADGAERFYYETPLDDAFNHNKAIKGEDPDDATQFILIDGTKIAKTERFVYENKLLATGHRFEDEEGNTNYAFFMDEDGTITTKVQCLNDPTHFMHTLDDDGKDLGEYIVATTLKPTVVEKPVAVEKPAVVEKPVVPASLTFHTDADGNEILDVPAEPAGKPLGWVTGQDEDGNDVYSTEAPVVVEDPTEAEPVAVEKPDGYDEYAAIKDDPEALAAAGYTDEQIGAFNAYETYVAAKANWDELKAAYDQYVLDKAAYDQYVLDLAAYTSTEEYEAYAAKKADYDEYILGIAAYNQYVLDNAAYLTYVTDARAYNAFLEDAEAYNTLVETGKFDDANKIDLTGLTPITGLPEVPAEDAPEA